MLTELNHISKYYEQPGTEACTFVLDDITLSIGENESLAITGPSGSGKSTLLNILGTLDKPSSGKVIINGLAIESLTNDQLAELRNRYIGFVFQMHHLLPQLSLIENVLLPVLPQKEKSIQKAAKQRARHLLERVGLIDHLHKQPVQLSAGECQRAAVVRALINQPRLLLADEPTGSLDAGNAEQLGQLLTELKKEEKFSLVLVTHSQELAQKMDKIYRLSSGKLNQI